jgi:hypothetical protein
LREEGKEHAGRGSGGRRGWEVKSWKAISQFPVLGRSSAKSQITRIDF